MVWSAREVPDVVWLMNTFLIWTITKSDEVTILVNLLDAAIFQIIVPTAVNKPRFGNMGHHGWFFHRTAGTGNN